MYIESLALKNFRNYKELDINFSKNINILYGDNAQGKTNILESVFIGATTKSHKQSKDKDIIRFGSEEAHIKIELIKNEKIEIEKKEIEKREKYKIDFESKKMKQNNKEETALILVKKESFITKILSKIKKIFNIKQ